MKKTKNATTRGQFATAHILTTTQSLNCASGRVSRRFRPGIKAMPVGLWQRGILACFIAICLAILGTLSASADTITQLTDDAYGTSSFIGSTNWSDGLAPSGTNDYEVDFTTLYTPFDNSPHTFAGNSLMVNDGQFQIVGTNVITVNNLILVNNGTVAHFATDGSTVQLAGNIILMPGALNTLYGQNNTRTMYITADISGAGGLYPAAGGSNIHLQGNNTYTGQTWVGCNLFLDSNITSSSSVFVEGATIITTGNNRLGNTYLELDGGQLVIGGNANFGIYGGDDTVGTYSGFSGSFNNGVGTLTATNMNLVNGTLNGKLNAGTLNITNWYYGENPAENMNLGNNDNGSAKTAFATAGQVNIFDENLWVYMNCVLTTPNIYVDPTSALFLNADNCLGNPNCSITLDGGALMNNGADIGSAAGVLTLGAGHTIYVTAKGGKLSAGWSPVTMTINGPIIGTGGLLIDNNGNDPIQLNGTCSCPNVSVQGTLIIGNNNCLSPSATVNLNGGSEILNMNGYNNTVAVLQIDGVNQANGTWGGTGSGAANISPLFAAGPGILTVSPLAPSFARDAVVRLPDGNVSVTGSGVVGTPYRLWATTNLALTPVTTTWTLIQSGTVTVSPFTLNDLNATNYPHRFYLFSTP
jgi:hypothetical protein